MKNISKYKMDWNINVKKFLTKNLSITQNVINLNTSPWKIKLYILQCTTNTRSEGMYNTLPVYNPFKCFYQAVNYYSANLNKGHSWSSWCVLLQSYMYTIKKIWLRIREYETSYKKWNNIKKHHKIDKVNNSFWQIWK